jgi:hypothetical protein
MKKFVFAALAACVFAIGVMATMPPAARGNSAGIAAMEDPIFPLPLPPRPDPLA